MRKITLYKYVFNGIPVFIQKQNIFVSNSLLNVGGKQNTVLQMYFSFCSISLRHACLFQHVDLPFYHALSHHPLFMLPCRIVELFPAVPINPHWGIVSKCLAYSKAACDPFVYSLLRHQYKKTCTDIINKLLKRSSLNASGRQHESQVNSIPTVEWPALPRWEG